MANIYDEQIKTMQRLINYGINENVSNDKSVVEYHTEGADGKTYGIIRECNKFYIKVAPKKDTALLAEDYDYIGGFNNKKENEFSSYNVASKQLELKMRSLNEANKHNQKSTYQFKPQESAEWQINETREMRAEINRFNDIMYNVNGILSEDKDFTMKHTLPEAPDKNPSSEKVNGPFTETAEAEGDKDFKKEEKNYQKAGAPFMEDGTVDDKDMESTANPKSNSDGNVYTEKPQYVETGVAGEEVKGGKSVKMNENCRVVKINENQALSWSQLINENDGIAIHNNEDLDDMSYGCGKVNNEEPYSEIVEDEELPFPEVECILDDECDYLDDECDYLDDECDDDIEIEIVESITLNDFGKHPKYRVEPITLPSNKEVSKGNVRDWDDASTKTNEPFGQKIGASNPYTEEVVNQIVDTVCNRLSGKKKV